MQLQHSVSIDSQITPHFEDEELPSVKVLQAVTLVLSGAVCKDNTFALEGQDDDVDLQNNFYNFFHTQSSQARKINKFVKFYECLLYFIHLLCF